MYIGGTTQASPVGAMINAIKQQQMEQQRIRMEKQQQAMQMALGLGGLALRGADIGLGTWTQQRGQNIQEDIANKQLAQQALLHKEPTGSVLAAERGAAERQKAAIEAAERMQRETRGTLSASDIAQLGQAEKHFQANLDWLQKQWGELSAKDRAGLEQAKNMFLLNLANEMANQARPYREMTAAQLGQLGESSADRTQRSQEAEKARLFNAAEAEKQRQFEESKLFPHQERMTGGELPKALAQSKTRDLQELANLGFDIKPFLTGGPVTAEDTAAADLLKALQVMNKGGTDFGAFLGTPGLPLTEQHLGTLIQTPGAVEPFGKLLGTLGENQQKQLALSAMRSLESRYPPNQLGTGLTEKFKSLYPPGLYSVLQNQPVNTIAAMKHMALLRRLMQLTGGTVPEWKYVSPTP